MSQPLAFDVFGGRYEGTLNVTFAETPTSAGRPLVEYRRRSRHGIRGQSQYGFGTLAANIDLTGKEARRGHRDEERSRNVRLDVTNGIVRNLGLMRSVSAATALSFEGVQRAAAGGREMDEPFSHLGGTVVARGWHRQHRGSAV